MRKATRVFAIAVVAVLLANGNVNAAYMFYVSGGSVYRANTDGSAKTQLFAYSGLQNGFPTHLDVDPVSEKVYWYGEQDYGSSSVPDREGVVKRMNYDGSGLEVVIDGNQPGVGLSSITYGFALDLLNRTMYMGGSNMRRASMDGTGLMLLPPYAPNHPYYPHDMEVDTANSKFYYTDAVSYNGVKRANLDGTSVENILNWGGSSYETFIALDSENNRFYYTFGGELGLADLDGSNRQVILTGIDFLDVELSKSEGKLYWTTHTKIQRANLDGTSIEDLLTLDPAASHREALSLSLVQTVVPEPSALTVWSFLAFAGIGCGWWRKRRSP